MVVEQFDEMIEQCERHPLVMNVSVHPYVFGQPFRLRQLRRTLKHCVEHPKGTPTLTTSEVNELLNLVPGWQVTEDGTTLQWQKRLAHFVAAVNFVDKLAVICRRM
mgnify:CR=1 FL=1